MGHPWRIIASCAVLWLCMETCYAKISVRKDAECVNYLASLRQPSTFPANTTSLEDQKIVLWQGVLLLICFGAFAAFIAVIYWVIRMFVYQDTQLVDTFYDAGGNVNAPLTATSIVTKYTWISTFVVSTWTVTQWGVVGAFWFSAASVVPIFLFAMMAAELKIKSPGAKTYLQVIKARFGSATHIVFLTFAFLCNLFVCAILMKSGVDVIVAMVEGLSYEVCSVIVALVLVVYTLIGGLGATFYVSYFTTVFFFACIIFIFVEFSFNVLGITNIFVDRTHVYKIVACSMGTDPSDTNVEDSFLTFFSNGGLLWAIVHVFASLTVVFVDNTYWQSAVAAKPSNSVYGYLTAGISWFAIPFSFSFLMGIAYITLTIEDGISIADMDDNLLSLHILKHTFKMHDTAAEFVFFMLIVVALCTSAASEVIGTSAIIMYDVYQPYISPIKPVLFSPEEEMSQKVQVALRLDEHRVYDRRCATIKYAFVVVVAVLLIPIALIINVIPIDMPWLFQFMGIVFGSCVVPIALGMSWHRINSWGMISGAVGGFACGVAAWLIYAAMLDDGNGLADFRKNTGNEYSMIVGTSVSLGVGGLLCIIVSLSSGGCGEDVLEIEEWGKTRSIDNPICSWIDSYMEDIKRKDQVDFAPDSRTIRKTYPGAEICGYVGGVLLSVTFMLVWPALMLLTYIWQEAVWEAWWIVILVWLCVAAFYCVVLPLFFEIYNICNQVQYNKVMEKKHEDSRHATLTKNYEYYHQVDDASTIGSVKGITHLKQPYDNGISTIEFGRP